MTRRLVLCLIALAGCVMETDTDAPDVRVSSEPENELSLDSDDFAYDLSSPIPFEIVDQEEGREIGDVSQPLITGTDDRVRVATTNYPYRAHAALRRTSLATDAYCSGFKITPRHILTAAHCLYLSGTWQSYPETMRVVLRQDGTNTGTKYQPIRFWVPTGWTNSTPLNDTTPDWNYDYALITLADSANTPGWLDFRAEPNTSSNLMATFGGYPGASSSCTKGISGRCAGWLYYSRGTFDAVYTNTFVTRADWESGQSGGPIYYPLTNVPAGAPSYRAVGIISNERLPAPGSTFIVGTHGNRGLRITSTIETALCGRINSERPSTVATHHCYR